MKVCRRCGEYKDFSCFNKASRYKDGLNSLCKSCKNVESYSENKRNEALRYYWSQHDPYKEHVGSSKICSTCKKYTPLEEFDKSSVNKDGLSGRCKTCRKLREKPLTRKHNLRSKYDLTEQEYDYLVYVQGNKCAICSTIRPGGYGIHWQIDHDHITGEVRGLLCSNCNTALGLLKEDRNVLHKAAEYLDNPPAFRKPTQPLNTA